MKTLLSLILLLGSLNILAEVVTPPKTAALCVACHGVNGKSNNDLWPNLAGQKKLYLSKQLLAFKNGQRVDSLMSPITNNLSEEEIQALAQYFSAL